MPVPRHSVAVPSVQLPVAAACYGVTELRVHGVGGTPPDAILGDLAPEQVSGDTTAGFYRSSDHRADRPALVTFGSPVGKLYGWGFPGYVGRKLLEPLDPGGSARLECWRNFFYPTDPIGEPAAPDLSAPGANPVDSQLLDPTTCYYLYGQPPSSQGHSGYWADPRVWSAINQIAAGEGWYPPVDDFSQAPSPTGDGSSRTGAGEDRGGGEERLYEPDMETRTTAESGDS
jgi:hypothetical protein